MYVFCLFPFETPIFGTKWAKYPIKLCKSKSSLWSAVNCLLFGCRNDYIVSDLRVALSSAQKAGQLNSFFFKLTDLKDMLEEMDYSGFEIVFQFIAAFHKLSDWMLKRTKAYDSS